MQRTTTTETSMQVILQKGRHAPWKIFPDESLVSFSAVVALSLASPVSPVGDAPSGASAVAPPPTHRWDFLLGALSSLVYPYKLSC
jgi:peptidoglycan/LPS O-acetylase OafA/YrhL